MLGRKSLVRRMFVVRCRRVGWDLLFWRCRVHTLRHRIDKLAKLGARPQAIPAGLGFQRLHGVP